MTGTGESGWFLFCSFGILSWSRGEDEACWGRATVNFICTSRNTQTNHRERTRGRDSTKGGFARIGGRHKPPFRGNALKPQQSAFGKVHRVPCCSNRHLPLGESLLFAGSVCLCVTYPMMFVLFSAGTCEKTFDEGGEDEYRQRPSAQQHLGSWQEQGD